MIMSLQDLTELDIFYISYDEPKKEEFWADISNKAPWAKRVDGVKGFDAAHKECARQSETDFFITVDGDNIVDTALFDDVQIIIPNLDPSTIYSFAGKNMVNGLVYGNGGIKIWPKQVALHMQTHENAEDERSQIEFCWNLKYEQMNNCYSEVWANGSPLQAFRSGFREGVKMSLMEGKKVPLEQFNELIYKKNLQRLLIWNTVGSDIENGLWSIYGARLGTVSVNLETYDLVTVRDYDWFDEFWETEIKPKFFKNNKCDETLLLEETQKLGIRLVKEIGLDIADMDAAQSKFFKSVYTNPPRVHPTVSERLMKNLGIEF